MKTEPISDRSLVVPDEIRAVREANGWTVEQLADTIWVSPLEVSAWEAGIVAPAAESLAWIRWHGEMASRDRAYGPGGIQPCPWIASRPKRLAGRSRRGAHPSDLDWTKHHLVVHASSCDACRRALELDAALPPIPPDPGKSPLSRWWRRVQALPGVAVSAVQFGVAAVLGGVLALLIAVVQWLQAPSEGFPLSATPFLVIMAGAAAFVLLDRPLRGAASRHPYRVWQLRMATFLAAPLATWLVLSGVDPFLDAWDWIFTSIGFFMLISWAADEMQKSRNPPPVPSPRSARDEQPRSELMPPSPVDGGDVAPVRDVVEAGRYADQLRS